MKAEVLLNEQRRTFHLDEEDRVQIEHVSKLRPYQVNGYDVTRIEAHMDIDVNSGGEFDVACLTTRAYGELEINRIIESEDTD